MNIPDILTRDLPDPQSASRFLLQFSGQHAAAAMRLARNEGLLSDVAALVSYSPLIAATFLHNPEYVAWLERKRLESGVRTKEQLLESLARFALTNSTVDHNILLARFRRRELIRIFLADIRRLLTTAEITEGISNLADAILEYALRIADQESNNRLGVPQETDDRDRRKTATFCAVSLGKLGSRELNYSSDIDLLFIYSNNGTTSATGTRDAVTNLEYFSKLAASVAKLVGGQSGEGAAYRVDLRLRPHGRVGPLALSLNDTVRYYVTEAQSWERQVLIRSRSSAGDAELFQKFFTAVESSVFAASENVDNALSGVRRSKQKIDLQHRGDAFIDVKLGRGGIREIEFIAQALQIAYGGADRWLRAPHTLISLSRIADRGLLSAKELSRLYDAYEFLRRLEHILQMENGLQTHAVPTNADKRLVVAKKMKFETLSGFDDALAANAERVHCVFERVFAERAEENNAGDLHVDDSKKPVNGPQHSRPNAVPSTSASALSSAKRSLLEKASAGSQRVGEMIAASPDLINAVPRSVEEIREHIYLTRFDEAIDRASDFASRLAAIRRIWSEAHFGLMVIDAAGEIGLPEIKFLQTALAGASIEAGLRIANDELKRRYGAMHEPRIAALGLGKLGSGGLDYDSDLDLVMVYDSEHTGEISASDPATLELYSRAVELFVTSLSSMTRGGSMYRIDLRLRPHGRNGRNAISTESFVDYVRTSAAVWELLAFVKLRFAGGDASVGINAESAIRGAIHMRASDTGAAELAAETRRIRLRLESERSRGSHASPDIKFGPGGMLDVYFAVRYLQLRDNLPNDGEERSTGPMLRRLLENNSLLEADHDRLAAGYKYLSRLDHAIRLAVGRRTLLPKANLHAMDVIAQRLELSSAADVEPQLALHRIEIRAAFDSILPEND